jgi:hypothetical protein
VPAFRAALVAAIAKERGSRARRPERVTAVASLTDADRDRLAETFELLLGGPHELGALVDDLHGQLRRLSPPAMAEEGRVDA